MFDKMKKKNEEKLNKNIRADLLEAVDRDDKLIKVSEGVLVGYATQKLMGSETVLKVSGGTYEKDKALLVLTDKRLVVFHGGLLSPKESSCSLANVHEVSTKTKLTGSVVFLKGSGIDVEVKARTGEDFVKAVQEIIYQ